MPPFDAAPVGRPFLGVPGASDDRPRHSNRAAITRRPEGVAVALFLAAATLIGGAGASYPLLEMAVELLSLGLLGWVCARPGARPTVAGLEWLLLALVIAVPLAQLAPLPVRVWTALPGRGLPLDVLTAVGLSPGAMPLSLAPAATLRAALALLPGVAFFLAIRAETAAGRRTVARAVIALAVASAALGAVQVAAGAGGPSFQSAHAGQSIGLFVNHNHQAAFLLVAILLAPAALRRPGERRVPPAAFGIVALLATAVVATTSRTGLALLPLCLWPMLWPAARRSPRAAAGVVGGIALLIGAGWWQGSVARLLDRFGAPELRPDIWRAGWAAMRTWFPAGAGVGAFRSVYPLAEARDALTPFLVNHAHNDFLELLLETGVAAAVGLLLFGWWFLRRVTAANRASVRGLAPAALGGVAVLLAFSAVDYPLRMLALTALFGLLCGFADPVAPRRASTRRWRFALLPVLALAALVVAKEGIARHRELAGEVRDPRRVLAWTPLDADALGRWALARQQAGDPAAARGWDVAERLGWRDPLTQVMLTARDADAGDARRAVAHADALLRQGRFDPTLLTVLRLGVADPRFADALGAMLAAGPPWRERYMMQLDGLDAAGVARHAMLVQAMATARSPVRADEAAALVLRAQAVGRGDVAQRGWAMLVGPARLGDPMLARVDASWRARRAVGGWHRTDLPGLDASGAGELQLDRSIAGTLLYQDLMLAPGRYTLIADTVADTALDAGALRWTATCAGDRRLDGGTVETGAGANRMRLRLTIDVPPGCVGQRLALDGGGGGIGPVQLRIKLSLTPN